MAAEVNQLVRAGLRTLIADDACLRAGARLGLQPEDTAKPWRGRTPLGRILEREGRLRGVLQRDPEPLEQVDEKNRFEEVDESLHLCALADKRRFGVARHDDAFFAKNRAFFADLVLESHQSVEQRFRTRRTT